MSTLFNLDSELMRRLREKWEEANPNWPPSFEHWLFVAIIGAAPRNKQQTRELLKAILKGPLSDQPTTPVIFPALELSGMLGDAMCADGGDDLVTPEQTANEILRRIVAQQGPPSNGTPEGPDYPEPGIK